MAHSYTTEIRDCMEALWMEAGGKDGFSNVDAADVNEILLERQKMAYEMDLIIRQMVDVDLLKMDYSPKSPKVIIASMKAKSRKKKLEKLIKKYYE